MTGSTWGDVAIGVFIAVILVWWVASMIGKARRMRRVIDLTAAGVKQEIEDEREAARMAQSFAAAGTDKAKSPDGPWKRPPDRR